MRLESLRGNWARVRVGSRKINRVYLKEPDSAVSDLSVFIHSVLTLIQDIKLRYYDLMVQLALQDDAYLEACSAYQEVWDTEEVKKDETREADVSLPCLLLPFRPCQHVFARCCRTSSPLSFWPRTTTSNPICCTSCTPTRHYKRFKSTSTPSTSVIRRNADLPHSDLLKCFITKELMRWPGIQDLYGPTLRQTIVFAPDSELGVKSGPKYDGKKPEEKEKPGSVRWEDLHKRVIEHVC